MLRANVGLSRKISRNYNSDGYSINLDAEITASLEDAEVVLGQIQGLFELAEEALAQEIKRDQGESAIERQDEHTLEADSRRNHPAGCADNSLAHPKATTGNSSPQGQDGQATNKQIQFLLTMGKRFKLSPLQLENRIAEIIGRRCDVNNLSKKEAGLVLDQLTKAANNG